MCGPYGDSYDSYDGYGYDGDGITRKDVAYPEQRHERQAEALLEFSAVKDWPPAMNHTLPRKPWFLYRKKIRISRECSLKTNPIVEWKEEKGVGIAVSWNRTWVGRIPKACICHFT